jgi:carbonic anhydrase/acetyltransferase-like protein (isoleucine patch superfamily)
MIYALDGIAPQIDPTAWIAPTAVLIGNVIIGPYANVWFGAVLRGDNEPIVVGAGSNVQENAVLHTDIGSALTIGADCTIGHKAMLHGCVIEDGCLIGMGATLLNGCTIGAGSLVGACALITEGKAIAAGSLMMGSPAKLVRSLDEAARLRLLKSAEGYRANAARFAAGMKPVA